jgi:hypothetical protein
MKLNKNTSIAVIVTREWVNRRCVRLFVREGREIPEGSDSHIIFARVLDAEDSRGLWIDNYGKHEDDPSVDLQAIMIPWNAVLSVVVRGSLSPHLWDEAKKLGFVSGEPST